MGQDGKEYTIPPGQIGGLVLGEDRDTGKYDVDPDTFSGRLADSLVNNGMNERSGDRFINVRELQHNLSSVDTRELVLDGLRHEKDNRNSKTAVKRFKSRLRQMGMTDEEITDAITEEEEEGEVTEEVPVGDITALSEGDSVIVTPPDWDSRHDEPWETDVVSINQSDGSVMVEDPNGGSYYISGDSVTDTLSWGEGERPDDSYPVVGYDSAVEELKGERVAAGTLSSVGLNNRDSAERVIENADSDELVNFVENNVVEELIQTAETLNPSVAEELRQDTDAIYDYRDSVISGVNNANADVRFAVSVLAVRGDDFWDMEIASGISGRTSEDETEERDDPRRLYDDLPQYTKEDIKNNLREITEQMGDVELAKTLTHLRSTTAADLSSDNNTAGVYSGKGNSISVDVDTDYSSTFTHELGHAWHHSSGIQSSAMDNRGVSDADDWNARFTPKMDSNDRTWEMSDEFEREWERYKTRYNESDSESNIQIRPYQKTNEGEFIAVTFASYIDDRSQLQEVHPEMVHLYDKYIGGGVETEEVDTIMGVSQFFEDDTPESPVLDVAVYDRVNVTAEYHEDIYNGEITSIQNASPQDSEEITYVIESGPEEHEIEASTIESMEKRL